MTNEVLNGLLTIKVNKVPLKDFSLIQLSHYDEKLSRDDLINIKGRNTKRGVAVPSLKMLSLVKHKLIHLQISIVDILLTYLIVMMVRMQMMKMKHIMAVMNLLWY